MKPLEISKKSILTAQIQWSPADLNIELSAALVDESEKLMYADNFVFYNSHNRYPPYDNNLFHSYSQWKQNSSPISLDGSVKCLLNICDFDYEYPTERIEINFSKISKDTQKIFLCASIYDREKRSHFDEISKLNFDIIDNLSSDIIFHSEVGTNGFDKHSALILGSFSRNDVTNWSYMQDILAVEEGLISVVERYCD